MTELEIMNSALIKAGSEKIEAPTDVNKRAITVSTQYPFIRDMLLYSYPFKFSMDRAILTVDPIPPVFGFAYRYELPADCLRPLDIGCNTTKWEVEGGYILTDRNSNMNLRYIKRVTDTSKFDSMFSEVLALYLAFDISFQLTQSSTFQEKLDARVNEMLRSCRSYSAQQGIPREWIIDAFTSARR